MREVNCDMTVLSRFIFGFVVPECRYGLRDATARLARSRDANPLGFRSVQSALQSYRRTEYEVMFQ